MAEGRFASLPRSLHAHHTLGGGSAHPGVPSTSLGVPSSSTCSSRMLQASLASSMDLLSTRPGWVGVMTGSKGHGKYRESWLTAHWKWSSKNPGRILGLTEIASWTSLCTVSWHLFPVFSVWKVIQNFQKAVLPNISTFCYIDQQATKKQFGSQKKKMSKKSHLLLNSLVLPQQ